jgi:hypothetical protein
MINPLVHKNPKAPDDELAREASEYFKQHRPLQVIATCIDLMREHQFPNMTFADLHKRFPAKERMLWLKERADVRQIVSTDLAGTPPKTARKRAPGVQAENIEEVIECGDKTSQQFDLAFHSNTLAIYGDTEGFAQFFLDHFDWKDTKNKARQVVVARLMNEFLAVVDGLSPILTHLELRRAISSAAWHMHVPIELRAEIDDARLAKLADKPNEAWTAKEELGMATPDKLVDDNLPLEEFIPVFKAWMKAVGYRLSSEMPTQTNATKSAPASAKTEHNTPTVSPAPLSDDGPKPIVSKPPPLPSSTSKSTPGMKAASPPLPPPIKDAKKEDEDFELSFDAAMKQTDPKA